MNIDDISKLDDLNKLIKTDYVLVSLLDKLKALEDGQILVEKLDLITYIYAKEGGIYWCKRILENSGKFSTFSYDSLSLAKVESFIFKEQPKWYENIPEKGILCWCWDNNINYKYLGVISEYVQGDEFPFITICSNYKNATPVKLDEVEPFIYKGEL